MLSMPCLFRRSLRGIPWPAAGPGAGHYLTRGSTGLLQDQVSYRLAGMWLTDAEFAELRRELARVLQPRLANPPAPGRSRRILASILLPGDAATRVREAAHEGTGGRNAGDGATRGREAGAGRGGTGAHGR